MLLLAYASCPTPPPDLDEPREVTVDQVLSCFVDQGPATLEAPGLRSEASEACREKFKRVELRGTCVSRDGFSFVAPGTSGPEPVAVICADSRWHPCQPGRSYRLVGDVQSVSDRRELTPPGTDCAARHGKDLLGRAGCREHLAWPRIIGLTEGCRDSTPPNWYRREDSF